MEQLTSKVTECAMAVHRELGSAFLESVSQKSLAIELSRQSLSCQSMNNRVETPLTIRYQNLVVGEFKTDIFVEDCLILELKAVSKTPTNTKFSLSTTSPQRESTSNYSSISEPLAYSLKRNFDNIVPLIPARTNPVKSC